MLKIVKSPLLWLVLGFGCLLGLVITRNPPVVFIFIVGISLLILFCRYPRVGLYFFLVSALWERMVFTEQFAVTLTGGKMIGWLAFAGWLYNFLITKKVELRATGQEVALGAFWLLCFASGLWARDSAMFWRMMFTLTQLIMLYYLINTLIRTTSELKTLLWVVLLCILLSSTISLFQYIGDPNVRAAGLSRNPNYISPIVIFGACIVVLLNKTTRSEKLKIFFIAAFIIILASLILTFSRGAMVSLAGVILYWIITEKRKAKALILLSLLALVFLMIAPERFYRRMATISEPVADASMENRILEAKAAIIMIQNNPILGVGWGNFSANYLTVVTPIEIMPRQAHNTYLEVTAELGIFGGMIFLWIIINTWKGFSRATSKVPPGNWLNDASRFLKMGFLAYLVVDVFMNAQTEKYFWILIALGSTLKGIGDETNKLDRDYLPEIGPPPRELTE